MQDISKDYSHIKGWGIDADPENDPTYPMKIRREGHQGYERKNQKQQPINREVLHSNERPNVSAVFGLAPAPSGLSGHIRRYAFKQSENSYGHWLPLLMADRVNELEGILDDIRRGKFPNFVAEKGWAAQWKHDRSTLVKKIAVYATLTAGLIFMLARKKNKS